MNKHGEAKWQGKSVCEDDIELTNTIIHEGDVVTGYLVYNDKQPYIVGDLVDVNESETALEYWIPVSETSLKNLLCEATEKELEQLQKKETPMKPKGSWNLCPNCNEELLSGHDLQSQFVKHCWNCGQKLDWSDEK